MSHPAPYLWPLSLAGAVLPTAALIVMTLIPTSRSSELGEFAIGLLLALVVIHPANREVFR